MYKYVCIIYYYRVMTVQQLSLFIALNLANCLRILEILCATFLSDVNLYALK